VKNKKSISRATGRRDKRHVCITYFRVPRFVVGSRLQYVYRESTTATFASGVMSAVETKNKQEHTERSIGKVYSIRRSSKKPKPKNDQVKSSHSGGGEEKKNVVL
jgi:hypothetical protein